MKKSLALILILSSSSLIAGTVSGGGPRGVIAEMNPDEFRKIILDSVEKGEVNVNGEFFEPGLIDLKKRSITLQSKEDANKSLEILEVDGIKMP